MIKTETKRLKFSFGTNFKEDRNLQKNIYTSISSNVCYWNIAVVLPCFRVAQTLTKSKDLNIKNGAKHLTVSIH